MGKPSWCMTSYPGQLSLAIPSWVGAVNTCTGDSRGINKHTAGCMSRMPSSRSVNWCLAVS